MPLLAEGGGRSAVLKLLGRLGALAPSRDDPDARWLRTELRSLIGAERFGAAEQGQAVSALLELLPGPNDGVALGAEDAAAVRAVAAWLDARPAGWSAVPVGTRDKYFELHRVLDDMQEAAMMHGLDGEQVQLEGGAAGWPVPVPARGDGDAAWGDWLDEE